jgi:glycine betaine/proline transport system substrate-binding protein
MDRAVNLDGLDPLAAARQWMDHGPDTVRTWLA